jgi:hypothetical protein
MKDCSQDASGVGKGSVTELVDFAWDLRCVAECRCVSVARECGKADERCPRWAKKAVVRKNSIRLAFRADTLRR